MADIITATGRHDLRWALTSGVGPIVFGHMVERFGSAEAALGASASALEQIPKVGKKSAATIAAARDTVDLDAEIAAAGEYGVRIIGRSDGDYPAGLREMADPPIVLYVKGELRPTDAIAVAIVGTRKCSIYGSEQARRFGELLAQAGLTVVSGLARGIDAFAHHGAVDAGGRTLAVMGAPLSEIYPPENKPLAERILECGAWISELPMSGRVDRGTFPSRNRIIAGLTLGTLVVEAPRRSGALITARLANEYNREVFAIPGRVLEPNAFGVNALIRDGGAKLTTDLTDILVELGELGTELLDKQADISDTTQCGAGSQSVPHPAAEPTLFNAARVGGTASQPAQAPPNAPAIKLSAVERLVLSHVGSDPLLQDFLMSACNLPPGEVLAALTALELKGQVKRLPGQLVMRAGRA